MNIWNKVFLGLIVVLGIAAWFFTSQEFTIRSAGQKAIASLEKQIVTEEQKSIEIQQGPASDKTLAGKTIEEMGLDDVQIELRNLKFEQKKAWFGCQPVPGTVKADGRVIPVAQLGNELEATPEDKLKPVKLLEVKLLITGPTMDNNGTEEVVPPEDLKGLVYVFDEGLKDEEGTQAGNGAFLGIFTVEGAVQKVQQGYQATLFSAVELNGAEVEQITQSARSTWAIYVSVPQDRVKGVFDRLSEETKQALKIGDSLSNPERPLSDFGELLKRNYDLRVTLKQNIEKANLDIASLNASLEIAKKEDLNLRKDIEFEKKRIAAMNLQRDAVQKKAEEYDDLIKKLSDDIAQTQKKNEWYVAQIADSQLKVKKIIEERAEQ